MSDTFSRVEVITGVARRRRFSTDPWTIRRVSVNGRKGAWAVVAVD
jgi:hypothetical protein